MFSCLRGPVSNPSHGKADGLFRKYLCLAVKTSIIDVQKRNRFIADVFHIHKAQHKTQNTLFLPSFLNNTNNNNNNKNQNKKITSNKMTNFPQNKFLSKKRDIFYF